MNRLLLRIFRPYKWTGLKIEDENKFVNSIKLILVIYAIAILFIFILMKFSPASEPLTYYDVFYSEENRCNLILEKGVACYKGCHNSLTLFEDLISGHNSCLDRCDETFYLEFDEKGDISYCDYRG